MAIPDGNWGLGMGGGLGGRVTLILGGNIICYLSKYEDKGKNNNLCFRSPSKTTSLAPTGKVLPIRPCCTERGTVGQMSLGLIKFTRDKRRLSRKRVSKTCAI